ncbi:MAG: glycerol-3-phosphate dehydrogenase/oxidase [Candidatus Lokiarchaeota archaeon]|nr:glycerol-3-phosphate dehydrogenase/oxidase [Candidatus Lokiarchaeota archaeon]
MTMIEEKLFDQCWNYKNRNEILKRLRETHYDIIVIGAGITGSGVAREASIRGLKVAVVDKQDFAAGTSSRSSKLAHGGIRYLGLGEMDIVRESTTERNWMRTHIPHLVRPIPFLFVAIEGGKYKKRDITGACKIYDFLGEDKSDFKNYRKHKWYSPEKIYEMEPEFIREGNNGGAVYYDNNVDDARLTIETLKEAIIRDADAINYCKVTGYLKEKGNIQGVKCTDLEKGSDFEIKGTLVVNATGIWTDELLENYPEDIPKPLIRPTKGVHLQFKREHVKNNMATIIRSISDERVFFVLPRNENFTIIGTTDTDYKGDLENPFCNKDDADYLLNSVKHYFPNADLDYDKILSTYAGIRPLVMQKGKSESQISRKHTIFFSNDGLLTITGGKLTAFRSMAEDLFKKIEETELFPNIGRENNFSKQKYLISLDTQDWHEHLKNSGINLEKNVADHIYQQYGKGALKILEIIKENESYKEKIIDDNYFIKAEIIYCLRYELTQHLSDLFCRRTEMSLWISHKSAKEAATTVANIMATEYSWDEDKKKHEITAYIKYVEKTVSFT